MADQIVQEFRVSIGFNILFDSDRDKLVTEEQVREWAESRFYENGWPSGRPVDHDGVAKLHNKSSPLSRWYPARKPTIEVWDMTKESAVFPSGEVEKLTGALRPATGDPCVHFPENISYDTLVKLVEIGAAKPDDAQNSSPTIQEFLDIFKNMKDRVSFIGYVVYPPRDDCRVSIEGFDACGFIGDDLLNFLQKVPFKDAYVDEKNYKQNEEDGTWTLHCWWD